MRISLAEDGAPLSTQLQEQIRGLITTGQLAAGERLPSVRQLASDLDIAPRTVAKAYAALQGEGLLNARIGGGTRVAPNASPTNQDVVEAARHFTHVCKTNEVSREEAIRTLNALW